jgi:pimeloyl-ACP methyl ester carboxylesterase
MPSSDTGAGTVEFCEVPIIIWQLTISVQLTIIRHMHVNPIMPLLMLVGVGIALCAAAIWLMAWSLAHPPRMTDGKAAWVLRRLSPADLGLPSAEVRFQVRDEHGKPLKIAAWWVPHPNSNGRCAVLIHGYGDAKVGAIAWAPLWHSLGFNLLVPDLRAHGESGGSVSTAGYFERHDLTQVIDDIRAQRPDDTRRIVLFGISVGAAVAVATAIQTAGIAAVVMESPYADFRRAAMAHMNRLGLPGGLMQRRAIQLAQWLTRADYETVNPDRLIAALPCPVLIVESGNDPFLAPQDRAALERAIQAHAPEHGPAEIWTVPDVEHLMALSADAGAYRSRLQSFLTAASILDKVGSASADGIFDGREKRNVDISVH